MHHPPVPPATPAWRKRENLVPGSALLVLAAIAWGYTLQVGSMNEPMSGAAGIHGDMEMTADTSTLSRQTTTDTHLGEAAEGTSTRVGAADVLLFLSGWAIMMVAMMLPAALPLILLYNMTAHRRLGRPQAIAGMAALLAGYVGIWTMAGVPVFGYSQLARAGGPAMTALPGLLLLAGGLYQFTALKRRCHMRCSSPLFFLTRHWRPGVSGAGRLGVLHGVDCLGCCLGLMMALVALGMMNVAWMLTAAVIIFVEKTLPGGHRVARALGIALIVGGVLVLGGAVVSSRMAM
ncbi:MAG: DUF2182 domain-containing protein [Gemmatimonadota bacterium]